MKNGAVVDILEKFANLLEFKGENLFKINAYRRAARTIAELGEDIEKVWQEGRLDQLPGIGDAIREKVNQFLLEGRIRQFDELAAAAPREIFDLLSIQHFGPKTAALAFKELGVETVADLRRVLEDGSLSTLPGMGPKKCENILKSLKLHESSSSQISIGLAADLVARVMDHLEKTASGRFGRLSAAGSVRRYKETVHDIDILVEAEDGREIISAFAQMDGVTRVLGAGATKGSILLDDRFQVDLRAVPSESFGAALQYFTGSQEHNVHLREIAKKAGYKVNEYGIFRDDQRVGGQFEEDIYHVLGLSWMPPELREDRGEIEAARQNRLPELVAYEDIRGDLHMHTNASDGQHAIEELVQYVRKRGYRYMAVCDHSKSAVYANGLNESRLYQQIETIRRLNEKMNDFMVLAGVEVDILPDGTLDFADAILKELDIVVASIHSAFKQDPTSRTIAAMENRFVDIIAHPTGRLISRREGFEIDMARIFIAAKGTGTALEVNSFWDRLDLCDIQVRKAVENGVKIAINTDAHHFRHLEYMALGVGVARRGWATKQDVINTFSLAELKQWQKRNR